MNTLSRAVMAKLVFSLLVFLSVSSFTFFASLQFTQAREEEGAGYVGGEPSKGDDSSGGLGTQSSDDKGDTKDTTTHTGGSGRDDRDTRDTTSSGLGTQDAVKSATQQIEDQVAADTQESRSILSNIKNTLKNTALNWYNKVMDALPLIGGDQTEERPTDLTSALGGDIKEPTRIVDTTDITDTRGTGGGGADSGSAGSGSAQDDYPDRIIRTTETIPVVPIDKGDVAVTVTVTIMDENGRTYTKTSTDGSDIILTQTEAEQVISTKVDYDCGEKCATALPYGYVGGAGQTSGSYDVTINQDDTTVVGVAGQDEHGNSAANYVGIKVAGTSAITDTITDTLENRDTIVVKTEETVSTYVDIQSTTPSKPKTYTQSEGFLDSAGDAETSDFWGDTTQTYNDAVAQDAQEARDAYVPDSSIPAGLNVGEEYIGTVREDGNVLDEIDRTANIDAIITDLDHILHPEQYGLEDQIAIDKNSEAYQIAQEEYDKAVEERANILSLSDKEYIEIPDSYTEEQRQQTLSNLGITEQEYKDNQDKYENQISNADRSIRTTIAALDSALSGDTSGKTADEVRDIINKKSDSIDSFSEDIKESDEVMVVVPGMTPPSKMNIAVNKANTLLRKTFISTSLPSGDALASVRPDIIADSSMVDTIYNSDNPYAEEMKRVCAARLSEEHCVVLLAQMYKESHFDPNAISPVGAAGIMQIMPGTAKELCSQTGLCDFNGKSPSEIRAELINNPTLSMELGVEYYNQGLDANGGDIAKTLAMYNGGPDANKASRTCPGKTYSECEANDGYAETRDYVDKILGWAKAAPEVQVDSTLASGIKDVFNIVADKTSDLLNLDKSVGNQEVLQNTLATKQSVDDEVAAAAAARDKAAERAKGVPIDSAEMFAYAKALSLYNDAVAQREEMDNIDPTDSEAIANAATDAIRIAQESQVISELTINRGAIINGRQVFLDTGSGSGISIADPTVEVNAGMNPLTDSLAGASHMVRDYADENMQSLLYGPLQALQEECGCIVTINDAIAKEGTSRETETPGSQHFHGTALDIDISNMTDEEKLALVEAAKAVGFRGFGLGDGIIHIDYRDDAASWDYGVSTFGGKPLAEVQQELTNNLPSRTELEDYPPVSTTPISIVDSIAEQLIDQELGPVGGEEVTPSGDLDIYAGGSGTTDAPGTKTPSDTRTPRAHSRPKDKNPVTVTAVTDTDTEVPVIHHVDLYDYYEDLVSGIDITNTNPTTGLPADTSQDDIIYTFEVPSTVTPTAGGATDIGVTYVAPLTNDQTDLFVSIKNQLEDKTSYDQIATASTDTTVLKAKSGSFTQGDLVSATYKVDLGQPGVADDKIVYSFNTKDGDKAEVEIPSVVDEEAMKITFAKAGFIGDEYKLLKTADYAGTTDTRHRGITGFFKKVWETVSSPFTKEELKDQSFTVLPVAS